MTTINNLRQTHTFVVLELPKHMTDLIAKKLRDAGYDHVFSEEDGKIVMDMNGLAIGTEDEEVNPISSIADTVQAARIDGNLNALAEGVQELFNEHPKKQPESPTPFAHLGQQDFRPFGGAGIPVVVSPEQMQQLEEDKNKIQVKGMDIAKQPTNNLSALKTQTVLCLTCKKPVDLLTPLSATGEILQSEGQTMFGQTLGKDERFALCGANPVTGLGNVYKVKFNQHGEVHHTSELLT